jgi:hypothetical protein
VFENSIRSKELLDYFNRKFGSALAVIVLLKCCAVVSCKLEWPRVSVLHVAPTRALKSFTSTEVMRIFTEEFWLDLKSDFTMNSLSRYETVFSAGVTLFANDLTALLASKAQRFKDRLAGGLSELFSDGSYTYQDFRTKFTLKGRITMVANITFEAYQNYKDRLFEAHVLGKILDSPLCYVKGRESRQQLCKRFQKMIERGRINELIN